MPDQHEIELINTRRRVRDKTWALLEAIYKATEGGNPRELGMEKALDQAVLMVGPRPARKKKARRRTTKPATE
jgi:hypothetical protein